MTPIDVSPKQLASVIDACIQADIPLMIWGDGGLGKSRIAEQSALASERRYLDFRALIKDLPDLQGFPILSGMQEDRPAPMTAPADLPPSDSKDPWLIVLEELPGAPRMMQGALYGLILERRLNSYRLPANTRIIATGNLATSGGVVQAMPKPLSNRFMHCRLVCTPDEHLAYAERSGWHPFVTAYHAMTQGGDWSNFDARSTEETYASPRSWERVSDLLNSGFIPPDVVTPMICGLIGYGIGLKFASFVRLYATLAPTVSAMRIDPDNCPLPTDSAALWFLAATTAADKQAVSDPARWASWAIPFLTRMSDELCVFAMHTATRKSQAVGRTTEFIKRFATNKRYAALAVYCK